MDKTQEVFRFINVHPALVDGIAKPSELTAYTTEFKQKMVAKKFDSKEKAYSELETKLKEIIKSFTDSGFKAFITLFRKNEALSKQQIEVAVQKIKNGQGKLQNLENDLNKAIQIQILLGGKRILQHTTLLECYRVVKAARNILAMANIDKQTAITTHYKAIEWVASLDLLDILDALEDYRKSGTDDNDDAGPINMPLPRIPHKKFLRFNLAATELAKDHILEKNKLAEAGDDADSDDADSDNEDKSKQGATFVPANLPEIPLQSTTQHVDVTGGAKLQFANVANTVTIGAPTAQDPKSLKPVPAPFVAFTPKKTKFNDFLIPFRNFGSLIDTRSKRLESWLDFSGIHISIGDLEVVSEQVIEYVPGEIAHIENVMQSEFRANSLVHTKEREETLTNVAEKLEDFSQDLQTSEKSEMQKEVSKILHSKNELNANAEVTSYGMVDITARAGIGLKYDRQKMTKTMTNFAKETTKKASSRVMNRVKTETIKRTLHKVIEEVNHEFDNVDGLAHAIGIYRFVDKVYQATMKNYGKRMMLEVVIDDPSELLHRHKDILQQSSNTTNVMPKQPMHEGKQLKPGDLTATNVASFNQAYGVREYLAYPEGEKQTAVNFDIPYQERASGGIDRIDNIHFSKLFSGLVIPPERCCYQIDIKAVVHSRPPQPYLDDGESRDHESMDAVRGTVVVQIAGKRTVNLRHDRAAGSQKQSHFFQLSHSGLTLPNLSGEIPINVFGYGKGAMVSVVAYTRPTEYAIEQWQHKAFDLIINTYQLRLTEYQEQEAHARRMQGVAIAGRNPKANRQMEKDLLKFAYIKRLTKNFAPISTNGRSILYLQNAYDNSRGYPRLDLHVAYDQAPIARFFEDSFEWHNMTYNLYPYFWGDYENWPESFAQTDPDPKFNDFLKASKASVLVPVSNSHVRAVIYYLATGVIWSGLDAPMLNHSLFMSIYRQINEETTYVNDRQQSAAALAGRQWTYRLPTRLLYLQKSMELPKEERQQASVVNPN